MILNVQAYLNRIGLQKPPSVTLEGLKKLHRCHLFKIPFENLDIELGNKIVLDLERLEHKIINKKRGGFCYELNGLFSQLLRQLGFKVKTIAARVYGKDRKPGLEFAHMALLVSLNKEQWLADVGFGRSFLEPLAFKINILQTDPTGRYKILKTGDSKYVLLWEDNNKQTVAQYIFSSKEQKLQDFKEMCHYHQTSSKSNFTQGRICSLATAKGRITLSKDSLIKTVDDIESIQLLKNASEVSQILKSHFDIKL